MVWASVGVSLRRGRIELCNPKFRKFLDKDAQADTMERDLDRVAVCVRYERQVSMLIC